MSEEGKKNGQIYAGIDVGSLTAEAVLVDEKGSIRGYGIHPTGAKSETAARQSFEATLAQNDFTQEDVAYVVATGYGRISVPFAHKRITEITCHGRGAHELNTETRTIIDIGGQDTKAIQLSAEGAVLDFVMNDKCAAGTGRFLEVMAKTLETDLSQMGPLGLQFNKIVNISSVCTVFAESEVVSLIAKGEAKEDIINGLHDSISERVISLAKRVHKGGLITMTGGVAKNPGVVHSLEKLLDTKLYIPEEPQIVGALGAALFARDRGIKE